MQENMQDPLDEAQDLSLGDSITIIDTSDQWTGWRDQLAEKMYDEWVVRRQGASNNN